MSMPIHVERQLTGLEFGHLKKPTISNSASELGLFRNAEKVDSKEIPPDVITRPVRTVVAVCDFSSAGINSTWRAAMVARELGAPLRILHPRNEARKLAKSKSSVSELRDEIWQRMSVATDIEAVGEKVLGAAVAAAREAAVVVIPSQRRNPLREWLMGTQLERLIRLCRTPVLVVKRPTLSSYRRVLVPVELEAAAGPLIAMAAALSRGPALEVLHVLGTADEILLRSIDASARLQHVCRQYRAQRAHGVLRELLAAVGGPGCGVLTVVEFGEAAAVISARAQASQSQLIVIGKRRRGLLADYLLGGVTQRVLATTGADVLVLPASITAGAVTRRDDPRAGLPEAASAGYASLAVPG
jgi:nucleotide-binding universal stress UspA family protein